MSSSRTLKRSGTKNRGGSGHLGRGAFLRGAIAALAAGTLLAGCGTGGFQPMYGSMSNGTEEKLARLEVAPIPGRVGQRIRNELRYQATGGANPLPPSHRLEISIRQRLGTTLVKRDGSSFSQIFNLDANFRLISIKDRKVVLEGTSHAQASFERFTSIYANVRAKRDAENRAAKTMANDLKIRLASFLAAAT